MIKAICFDLDGVYFLNGKSNFVFNLTSLGVPEEKVRSVFFESPEMKRYKLGELSDIAFWTWASRKWGIQKSVDELVGLLISGYKINEEAVNYVRTARKIGYKTLICSNNFPARIKGLDDKFKFLEDFDVVTLSYEVHALKPDVMIFKDLVTKAMVNSNEIIMADDDESKLKGAKEVGINTLFYEDFAKFKEDLRRWNVLI